MSTTTDTRQALPVGTWSLDPVHSTIGFEVDYLAGTFRGQFREVDAKLEAEGDTPVLDGLREGRERRRQGREPGRPPAVPGLLRRRALPGAELRVERDRSRGRPDHGPRRHHDQGRREARRADGHDRRAGHRSLSAASGFRLKLDTTVDRTEFGVNWNVPLPDGKPALADEVKLAAELYFVKEA